MLTELRKNDFQENEKEKRPLMKHHRQAKINSTTTSDIPESFHHDEIVQKVLFEDRILETESKFRESELQELQIASRTPRKTPVNSASEKFTKLGLFGKYGESEIFGDSREFQVPKKRKIMERPVAVRSQNCKRPRIHAPQNSLKNMV